MSNQGEQEKDDADLNGGPDFTGCTSLHELLERIHIARSVMGRKVPGLDQKVYFERDILKQISGIRQKRMSKLKSEADALIREVAVTGGLRDAVDKWAIPKEAME